MGRFHGNRILSNVGIYAARIKYEAKLLNEHYDKSFVSTSFSGMRQLPKLTCMLNFSIVGVDCKAKIEYNGYDPPKCWLVSPKFDDPQHIYKNDGALCLYDPKNDEWSHSSNIYNTFIPWCMEWVVFQMLYEETGEWQHPERHPNQLSEKELNEFIKKLNLPQLK